MYQLKITMYIKNLSEKKLCEKFANKIRRVQLPRT